jgi:hypothetical protein
VARVRGRDGGGRGARGEEEGRRGERLGEHPRTSREIHHSLLAIPEIPPVSCPRRPDPRQSAAAFANAHEADEDDHRVEIVDSRPHPPALAVQRAQDNKGQRRDRVGHSGPTEGGGREGVGQGMRERERMRERESRSRVHISRA